MILFALLLIVTLSGCQKQDDTEILKLKVNEEIQYLDTNIISMLNKLNNISFENYYVTTENIKLTDKELDKFILVLGVKKVKYLFCYNKIWLSNKQLDYLLSIKN